MSADIAATPNERRTPPLASIIVAAHNAGATLTETLASIERQTSERWECIIVDDGSTDDTFECARAFARSDYRFRVIQQPHQGTYAARNAGARVAIADWLVMVDADDVITEDAIDSHSAFIASNPGYAFYSWGHTRVRAGGSPSKDPTPAAGPREYVLEDALRLQGLPMLGAGAWETHAFRDLGGYGPFYAEDYELLLRALIGGYRWLHNPASLYVYRVAARTKSADLSAQIDAERQVYAAIATDPRLSSRTARLARSRLRATQAESARLEFIGHTETEAPRTLRQLWVRGIRLKSFSDRWLWATPLALLFPRVVGRALRNRMSTVTSHDKEA